MAGKLEGKTAVVTGAGRGIGRGIALLLAQEGARVVVADFGGSVEGLGRDKGPADEVVDLIRSRGGEAVPHYGDVSDWNDAEDMVRTAIDRWGKLDCLVNVAGILRERMVFNMTEEEWDAVIRVHLKGSFNTTHFASIHWRQRRQPGARLINFTSGAGINGSAGQPNYAAAKAGLIGFTKSCANALGRYGVTANCISPGAATRMTDRGLAAAAAQRQGAVAPSEVSGGTERDPANVAPVVAYLCSDEADYITGRTFAASGYRISLYREMEIERTIFSDGPWDLEKLFASFKSTLGQGLRLPDFRQPQAGGA
jgi:NAD(P)-dependent dehydrogenase (short-subunit alcohol dehydrogenase family)